MGCVGCGKPCKKFQNILKAWTMGRKMPHEIVTRVQIERLRVNGWEIVQNPYYQSKPKPVAHKAQPSETFHVVTSSPDLGIRVPRTERINTRTPPVWVVIPVWGNEYVETCIRYVIPSVKAALENRPVQTIVRWIIYTNPMEHLKFTEILGGYDLEFRSVPKAQNGHMALTQAHKQVIAEAPAGTVIGLLNADIVVSREMFCLGDEIFPRGKRVIATVGVRSLVGEEAPPIGASGRDLLEWSWRNRHNITEDLVYGRGKTKFPTVMIFDEGDNVMQHCFHLHPFVIIKDRQLRFNGTIDDDVLACYREDEIFYAENAEVGFAELSPAYIYETRFIPRGNIYTLDEVKRNGRNYIPVHMRNFKHALRIKGDADVDDSVVYPLADEMLEMIQHRRGVRGR